MRNVHYYSATEQKEWQRKEAERSQYWEDKTEREFSRMIWSVVSMTVGMAVAAMIGGMSPIRSPCQ